MCLCEAQATPFIHIKLYCVVCEFRGKEEEGFNAILLYALLVHTKPERKKKKKKEEPFLSLLLVSLVFTQFYEKEKHPKEPASQPVQSVSQATQQGRSEIES
jgi:hypothetical protein